MKKFSWKYTQFSQFNQSDTLLLVSGVHFGSPHSTSGEIAVFSVTGEKAISNRTFLFFFHVKIIRMVTPVLFSQILPSKAVSAVTPIDSSESDHFLILFSCIGDSHLRCRVVNRPYDIFGTWFSDQHLISGDLHWLAHLISTSVLWLNKANQEVDSEHVPIMNQLYKFYNRNASSIRGIMVANCPWLEDNETSDDVTMAGTETVATSKTVEEDVKRAGNPLSQPKMMHTASTSTAAGVSSSDAFDIPSNQGIDRSIQYSSEFRKEFDDTYGESEDDYDDDDEEDSQLRKMILIMALKFDLSN